jgi:hypothetical protein
MGAWVGSRGIDPAAERVAIDAADFQAERAQGQ